MNSWLWVKTWCEVTTTLMSKTESAHLAHSLEAGLEVKYLIMLLCIKGIRQQHRTTAFTAMIPGKQCLKSSRQWWNVRLYIYKKKACLCVWYVYKIRYQWRSSVLLWGCSRSRPPWTSPGWAVAGSRIAGSTSHANTSCPGSPGDTWMTPWVTLSWILCNCLTAAKARTSSLYHRTTPVRFFLPLLHRFQTEPSVSGSHIAEWPQHQRSSL